MRIVKIKAAFDGKFFIPQDAGLLQGGRPIFPIHRKRNKGLRTSRSRLMVDKWASWDSVSWLLVNIQAAPPSSLSPIITHCRAAVLLCYNVLLERRQGTFIIQTHPVIGNFHRSFLLWENIISELLISAEKCFYMESPFNAAFETIPFHSLNNTEKVICFLREIGTFSQIFFSNYFGKACPGADRFSSVNQKSICSYLCTYVKICFLFLMVVRIYSYTKKLYILKKINQYNHMVSLDQSFCFALHICCLFSASYVPNLMWGGWD